MCKKNMSMSQESKKTTTFILNKIDINVFRIRFTQTESKFHIYVVVVRNLRNNYYEIQGHSP